MCVRPTKNGRMLCVPVLVLKGLDEGARYMVLASCLFVETSEHTR